ncbi:hydrogenase nickel incorporation protein HypB [Sulfuriferula plumbiphila]|nr:hydrogenase nickel incorporation protein HypB [Sulfuriferula plumbiphila]
MRHLHHHHQLAPAQVRARSPAHADQPSQMQAQMPGGGMQYQPVHTHDHAHPHEHHHHDTLQVPGRDTHTLQLEAQILGRNQRIAERNRGWLAGRGILALNLMSSPGAGKTTLLERTLKDLQATMSIAVVEGDQETANDAKRIRATGARAVQVNTGTGCHLEADMLERAMTLLKPEPRSLLLIENVGNLVCPALFDLGERAKVVIFSVTEGEDKPLKYPHMFGAAEVMLLSKIDLMPHLRFRLDLAINNAHTVNPKLKIFPVSAYTGEGLDAWYDWLRTGLSACASVNAMHAMP